MEMSTFKDQATGQEVQIDPTVLFKAKERVGNSRARLLLQQPFYGVLLSMMDFIPEGALPTMATDGAKVYYNPQFVMDLTEDEVYGVLLHEISHCIYMHCTPKRRLNRAHQRWNVACDYAINLEIKDMGYALPGNLLLDNKYRDQNAEQIYDTLPEDCSKFTTLDMHIENSDETSWDDMEDKIITAYEMTKNFKGKGNTPAGLKRWIDKLRKNKVKWERIFHRYVGQALSKDDYSFVRVNKRFIGQGMYLPDMRSNIIGSVVIAIDTSGSISRPCLEQFAAEISKISYLVSEVTCMTCDSEVHEVLKIHSFSNWLNKLHFKGGGGTDFRPVFDKIKEMGIQPELVIYLTDLYGQFPEKRPNYPVLWCVTNQDAKAPWGQQVELPNEKDGSGW
ncbi:MAG: VWA-like domain-containing protein [Patescibacteria group bacterium]